MSLSMYDASVPVFRQMLSALSSIIDKTIAHAEAKKIDQAVYANARLYPDMFPFSRQIGVATGHGAAGFTFEPLDPNAPVHVGDRLVTGPTGASSFVPGLSVGTVTAVHTSTDGTTSATVRPATSPTAVDLVGLVLDTTTTSQAAGDPLVPRGGR